MAANYANLSSSSSSTSTTSILDDSKFFPLRNTTANNVKRENPYYDDYDSSSDFIPPTKRLKNDPGVSNPVSVLTPPQRPAPSSSTPATKVSQKPPAQVARRNARERRRVEQVNQGFVTLRNHIPNVASKTQASTAASSKKLSKVETLRAAAEYIKYLHKILNIGNPKDTVIGQGASNRNFQTYHQPMNHFSYCNNENLRYNNAECDFNSPCSSGGSGAPSSTDTSPQILNNFYANEAYHHPQHQTWYY